MARNLHDGVNTFSDEYIGMHRSLETSIGVPHDTKDSSSPFAYVNMFSKCAYAAVVQLTCIQIRVVIVCNLHNAIFIEQ